MKEEIAKALCERLVGEGYEPYPYSGRYMYGEYCVAIDLPSASRLFCVGVDVMRSADGADLLYSAEDCIGDVYTDTMGHGIVAYWRYIPWPPGYAPPISRDQLMKRVEEDWGDQGVDAVETSCLTDEDLAQGYDHCMERIRPALEEMGA